MNLLRYSLVFVWLATAFFSVWEWHGQSQQLLAALPADAEWMKSPLILGGSAVDAALGLWLWFKPSRRAYVVALAVMLGMTLLASIVEPSWWLHPLGPLTKNVPIAAILWVLARSEA